MADQRKPVRLDYSDISIREKLREGVDPQEVVDTLLGIMRSSTASDRDRLHAIKQIADRRDGAPVGMVLTGHVSVDEGLADLPDHVFDRMEALLFAQQGQQSLAAGEDFDDDDEL